MNDMPSVPPTPQDPPSWPPAADARPPRRGRGRKLAVGIGAAVGVAVGATALAAASTSSGTAQNTDATATASASTTTTAPPSPTAPRGPRGLGGPGFGGGGPGARGGLAMGGPGFGGGSFIYGQFTVKGPSGYETLSERTGTVSDVTDTSGSTWSLTVKSADGTSGTFTVDSGTSVNGGEMGIGSVKTGDTVRVAAVVSGSTSTAKQVTDDTTLKANGGTWQPTSPPAGSSGNTGSSNTGSSNTETFAPPV